MTKPYIFLGTAYGGWPLLRETTNSNTVIFSFGLGTDVSFDVGAIREFGSRVIGFDPTPRSIEWLSRQTLPEGFSYHQIGIAAKDGEAEFFLPKRDDYISFSAQPNTSVKNVRSIKAPVRRLQSIIEELKLPAPDVLKMDIEGFEYDVVDDLIASPLRPQQLLIEFHHGMYGIPDEKTKQAVVKIMNAGYEIFFVSKIGHEYGFALAR